MTTRYVDHLLSGTTNTYSIANRNASGTDGNGHKTVDAAISAAADGDTLFIRSGTYQENKTTNISPLRQHAFYINKALTIQAYNDEAVVLTYDPANPPQGEDGGPFYLMDIITLDCQSGSGVTLDGLTIVGTYALGDTTQDTDINISISRSVGGVTIRNCDISGFGHAGIKAGETVAGVVTVEKCHIHDGGFTYRDHGIYFSTGSATYRRVFRWNDIHHSAGYGIHLFDPPPAFDIYGNVIHHNGTANVAGQGGGILLGGPNHHVYNNTIADNQQYGGIVLWKQTGGGSDIRDNIFWNNTVDVRLDDSAGGNTVNKNCYHSLAQTGSPGAGAWDGSTQVDLDPLFVTSAPRSTWQDYRLQSGSPLLRLGISVIASGVNPLSLNALAIRAFVSSPDLGAFAMSIDTIVQVNWAGHN